MGQKSVPNQYIPLDYIYCIYIYISCRSYRGQNKEMGGVQDFSSIRKRPRPGFLPLKENFRRQVGSVDWGYGAAGGQRLEQRFATSLSCRCGGQPWWNTVGPVGDSEKENPWEVPERPEISLYTRSTWSLMHHEYYLCDTHLWCNTYIFQHDNTLISLWIFYPPLPFRTCLA